MKDVFHIKKKKNVLINILLFISLAVFIGSAVKIFLSLMEYNSAKDEYTDLQKTFFIGEQIAEGNPDAYRKIDFESLKSINPDVIAWIYIKDTPINYPVVQGPDNRFYLNKTYEKKTNSSGAIFLDSNVSPDFTDFNSIIYGHHMRNGSMFAQLKKFRDKEFFDSHPTGYLYTPTGTFKLDIFAEYVSPEISKTYTIKIDGRQFRKEYIDYITLVTGNKRDISVTENDRVITLSTCTYEFKNARYVVHAKASAV